MPPATNSSALYDIPCPPITDAQFHAFHAIDRQLYTELIINLGRDPAESMQLMGFWVWLEQELCEKMNLITTILQLPYTLVSEVADESLLCLKCVETDHLPPSANYELAVLPNLVGRKITAQYFHENRIHVLSGVTKLVSHVCVRAFSDILQKTFGKTLNYPSVAIPNNATLPSTNKNVTTSTAKTTISGEASSSNAIRSINYTFPTFTPVPASLSHTSPIGFLHPLHQTTTLPISNENVHGHARSPAEPRQDPRDYDIAGMIGRLNLFEDDDDDVLPDDRTIFLTFSKGYPISEIEVKDFFMRKFGDVIQAVHMQDVEPYEQVLYAKVVARSAAFVDRIVDGGRAKYNINGKHVWARKYVKKQSTTIPMRII